MELCRKYQQLGQVQKERIIEEIMVIGYQPTQVAQNLQSRGYKVSKKTVMRYHQRHMLTGSTERKPGSGRPTKITPALLAAVQSEMSHSDETTGEDLLQRVAHPAALDINSWTLLRARRMLGYEYKTM